MNALERCESCDEPDKERRITCKKMSMNQNS